MRKSIQFVLSASLVLWLSSSLMAQSGPKSAAGAAPVLLALNHDSEDASKASVIEPDISSCWSQSFLSPSVDPAVLLEEEDLTATVNMASICNGRFGDYTGSFVFYDRDTVLGTVNVDNFSATLYTTSLTAGRHRITAVFMPNGTYRSSSATILLDVVKQPAPITLSITPNPSTFEEPVTFTATVTSGIEQPTGKVRFSDGTKDFGIATLDENGVATFTKKNLAVGTHSITAEYYGDAISATSIAPAVTLVVGLTAPMTAPK
ncbi:MAG TPA: Ig-like domain-containing protein [Terriglobales bacterium]|nr:Ig-like domain-containing protein [Terriglobales bacterium]